MQVNYTTKHIFKGGQTFFREEKNVINYYKKKFLHQFTKREYNLNQDENSANKENSQDFTINKSR